MEPSKVQEAEKPKKTDPEPPMMEAEEPNATRVSALNKILESLARTTTYSCDLAITLFPLAHQEFVENYLDQFYHLLVDKLSSLTEEKSGVSEIFLTVLEILHEWSHHLVFDVLVEMNCVRCKMVTQYPLEPCFGIFINANSLRETKSAFEDFTFERIIKFIKNSTMMPCKTEGCEKLSYVDHIIPILPSVFTIALEWGNNETREEILGTTSVLVTEIDISKIYKYEGGSPQTNYILVSMVCSHGDQYVCVAYGNSGWVCYFPSDDQQFIGDWGSVIDTIIRLNMRPEFLFFENDMHWKVIVNAQINTPIAEENKLVQEYI